PTDSNKKIAKIANKTAHEGSILVPTSSQIGVGLSDQASIDAGSALFGFRSPDIPIIGSPDLSTPSPSTSSRVLEGLHHSSPGLTPDSHSFLPSVASVLISGKFWFAPTPSPGHPRLA